MKRFAVSALLVGVTVAAVAHCGGTTGREGNTLSNLGTVDGGDATVAEVLDAGADQSLYTNTFDVAIEYADQALPDVEAPPEGGSGGGDGGPPNCPPFILLGLDGGSVPLGGPQLAYAAVPSEYTSDGGTDFAPAGSVCARYPWLGSIATDQCVLKINPNPAAEPYVLFPPCNWAVDAGVAVKGAGAGVPRYDLCMDMYNCFVSTRCYLRDNYAHNCFCGIPDTDPNFSDECSTAPQGACLSQILAAVEDNDDPHGINDAFSTWQDVANAGPGFEGRFLEDLFENIQQECTPPACAAIGLGVAPSGSIEACLPCDAGGSCSP